jgi:isoleucyl-tRNA synthetase
MNQMNFKQTLNLPRTKFGMKANLIQLEPKILSYWEELNIYQLIREKREGKEKFVLHDGPPYANGLIHIGHALNKILKDIIIKYKTMKGFDCPFIVGWDCHGLPVEHQLFKELNLNKNEVNIVEFRKKAKDFALKFVELQKKDFKRLGVFSNWDNPYLTLDKEYEYYVIQLLKYLTEEGYIYRARFPVNWCARCETALAEAEVEYLDKESDSIYLLFEVKEGNNFFEQQKAYFLVWTTTPWTLVSNVAVALHPDYEYCLVNLEEKTVLLCKDLISQLEEKIDTKFKIIKSFKGKELEFIKLKHPFLNRESLVILGDFVSNQEGTGCVHIAPGHGEEDFHIAQKYKLPTIMPVNKKGEFEEPQEFKGKNVNEASILIIETLKKNKFLIKHEKIIHSYPHCWRCKNPIIFRATFQWFLNVDHKNLRSRLLEEIEKVQWVPSSGKERIKSMIIQRPHWCLSRQRLWGVPIPAVRCKNCQEVILDVKIVEKTAQIFKECGSCAWFIRNIEDFIPSDFSCPKCEKKEFIKENDILDVWFESGASFLAVVKKDKELSFPADMYLEGSDQHRGWFQVSLIPSVAKESVAPFKIVLTHGFVVDGEGRKMSKSLGNVISPQEVINKYGAEILRLWAVYSDYSEDIKISESIISQLIDVYRKIRNTIRFLLGNLYDFDPQKNNMNYPDLLEVDKFMLSKLMILFKETITFYEEFSFYKAIHKIFDFCNIDLSAFYLDILKDRLYTFSQNSKERRSAQFTLYHILRKLLRLIAPVLSFTAEEAYLAYESCFNRKKTIFDSSFEEIFFPEWIDEKLLNQWNKILQLRDVVLKEIEKKREEKIIGSSLEAEVILNLEEEFDFYKKYQDVLREVFIVSEVKVQKGNYKIEIEKAKGKKCMRCWNWRKDVGNNEKFPQVCIRCAEVLEGGKNEKTSYQKRT